MPHKIEDKTNTHAHTIALDKNMLQPICDSNPLLLLRVNTIVSIIRWNTTMDNENTAHFMADIASKSRAFTVITVSLNVDDKYVGKKMKCKATGNRQLNGA